MAATGFVGRRRELSVLDDHLQEVVDGLRGGSERPGRCLLLRGRRRVGKSRLIEEFRTRAELPGMFYTAVRGALETQINDFAAAASADLPAVAALAGQATFGDWSLPLRLLADALPADQPSIVVLDEVPYLMDAEGVFESTLQRAWDTQLSRKPVLLILVGSDISMMQALNTYDRPFHQRGVEMVLNPLNPSEVGRMLGSLSAPEVFDAALITGGLPRLCASWREGEDFWGYLERSVAGDSTPFVDSAVLSLGAEFPDEASARTVLTAIGSDARDFSSITNRAGMSNTTVSKALGLLAEKRMVAVETPLSMVPKPKLKAYRVADPYMRFWLGFIGPHLSEIERGRGDLVLARIRASWTSWRGRAVEPMVRDAVSRLLPLEGVPSAAAVGGYWLRNGQNEVDLVGVDKTPSPKQVLFAGSIKWRDSSSQPFGRNDYDALVATALGVPGYERGTPLVGVSRSGFKGKLPLTAALQPEDLLAAWD